MEKIQFGTIGRKKLFYSSDIEQNEDGALQLTIGIWLGQNLSGIFELFFKTWEQSYYDSNCRQLMDALERQYDVLQDAPVVHFKIGELSDDNLKGRGIGKEAYKIAVSEAWKHLQRPFYFASDACEEGFTSTAAGRVWKALRNTFPMASYGRRNDTMWGFSVFGIVEEPVWDRTIRPYRKKRQKRKNPMIDFGVDKYRTGRKIEGYDLMYTVNTINMQPWALLSNEWRLEISFFVKNACIGKIELSSREPENGETCENEYNEMFASYDDLMNANIFHYMIVSVDNFQIAKKYDKGGLTALMYLIAIKYSYTMIEERFLFQNTVCSGSSVPVTKNMKGFWQWLAAYYPTARSGDWEKIVACIDDISNIDFELDGIQYDPIIENTIRGSMAVPSLPFRTAPQEIGIVDDDVVEYIFTDSRLYPDDTSGALHVYWNGYEDGRIPFGIVNWTIYPFSEAVLFIECEDLYDDLVLSYPQFDGAPVVEIKVTEDLPDHMLQKGFGKMMYRILIQEFWMFFEGPFIMTTNRCVSGSTSVEATRVWSSLARNANGRYKAFFKRGRFDKTLIAVDENPNLVDLNCLLNKGLDVRRFLNAKSNPRRRKNRSMLKKKSNRR